MLMLPSPNARMLLALAKLAVFVKFCVNKCYIAVVNLGLFVNLLKNSLRTGNSGNGIVKLL